MLLFINSLVKLTTMEITVARLLERGFTRREDLIRGRVDNCYEHGTTVVIYLIGVAWYVQTEFDYPSVRFNPVTTFEQLSIVTGINY